MKRKRPVRRAIIVGIPADDRYEVMLASGASYGPLSLQDAAAVLDDNPGATMPSRRFRSVWQRVGARIVTPAAALDRMAELASVNSYELVLAAVEWDK